jgi:hypothetical protein
LSTTPAGRRVIGDQILQSVMIPQAWNSLNRIVQA